MGARRDNNLAVQCAIREETKNARELSTIRRKANEIGHRVEKLCAAKRTDVAADEERAIKPARVALDGGGPDVTAEDQAEAAREQDDALLDTIRKPDRRWRRLVVDGHGRVSKCRAGVLNGRAGRQGGHGNKAPVVLGRDRDAVECDDDVSGIKGADSNRTLTGVRSCREVGQNY